MTRRALALVPWLAIVLVMALLARQEVSAPAPAVPSTPGVVQVTAYVPFRVVDSSGIALVCIANQAARTFPPMLRTADPTIAPTGGVYIPTGATRSTSTTYAPGGGNE